MFSSFSIDCFWAAVLQYNEILGKGASKTVYETFLHNLLKFLKNPLFWNSVAFFEWVFSGSPFKGLSFFLPVMIFADTKPSMSMKGLK